MGPADGIMTTYLADHFEILHVVDCEIKLLNEIPDLCNISKFQSLFENFAPPQKYDTIIMEHILEHVEDPQVILHKAKNWLNDNGVMIIGVPNAKSIHRLAAVKMGLLNSEYDLNQRDLSQGHRRVYDSDLLEKEIQNAKLKIIHKGGVFLKVVSNQQIEDHWNQNMIQGFYELSDLFPDNTADIFIIAEK